MNMLLDPPFAKDPPVKLNIPAKTLGLVYAILAAIGVLFGALGVLALLGLSGVAAVAGVGGTFGLVVIGSLISLVGTALAAWGGYRMYQGDRSGKRNVIYGLVVSVIGGLVSAFDTGITNWVVNVAFTFVLYYLVIISRFEDEPKLV